MTNFDQSPRKWPISYTQKLFLTNFDENRANQTYSKIIKFQKNINIQIQIESKMDFFEKGPIKFKLTLELELNRLY